MDAYSGHGHQSHVFHLMFDPGNTWDLEKMIFRLDPRHWQTGEKFGEMLVWLRWWSLVHKEMEMNFSFFLTGLLKWLV